MKMSVSVLVLCLAFAELNAELPPSPTAAPGNPTREFRDQSADPLLVFRLQNLMAWCIVPFDAKKRGSEERAQMLVRLGIRKLAYDWRPEHISTFDTEVETMKRHGIEITAWWFPSAMDDTARTILAVIERHKIQPQLWVTGSGAVVTSDAEQTAQVEREAARIRPIAEAARRLGCQVGLYNHGGWFGEPENQIAIIDHLKRDGLNNIGIVYNFHHGHDHVTRFAELWKTMQPRLLSLNINGMSKDADKTGRKILTLGSGDEELNMLRVVRDSAWHGPVGILNHRAELDAEAALRDNLRGLDQLCQHLKR